MEGFLAVIVLMLMILIILIINNNIKLQQLVDFDPLTQAFNRRGSELRLKVALASRASICLLMVDLDYFKRINDAYGHPAGDFVLQQVTARIKTHLRHNSDHVARYGGEEFAVLLASASMSEAVAVAARIHAAIAEPMQLPTGETIRVTASIGLAQATAQEPAQQLLARADRATYAAKEAGRDQLLVAA
jgi:diguanylate cyclase (GGDEF)-like protein